MAFPKTNLEGRLVPERFVLKCGRPIDLPPREIGRAGADFTSGDSMRFFSFFAPAKLFTGIAFLALFNGAFSQQPASSPILNAAKALPEAPQPQASPADAAASDSQAPAQTAPVQTAPAPQSQVTPQAPSSAKPIPESEQQPKRILGVMPNYRAVSAGAIPPPPTAKEAFILATQNSFDYSSFVFVGITSLLAKGTDAHPQLGKGVAGFGRYYWRGFVDKTDGNYLVLYALPTVLHQDERYYAKGEGSIWGRGIYAASRVLITPDYHGKNTFNSAEIFGRGMAQGISLSYYPSQDRTVGDFSEKYGYAVGRDALTNVFREFWPDIAVHVLHRHP